MRALFWIFGLLIFLAGCTSTPGPIPAANESVALVQSSTTPGLSIINAPTPPKVAPVVLKTTPTVPIMLPTATPNHTPTDLSTVEPAPTGDAIALQEVGLPVENDAGQDHADPVATIAAQLDRPIDETPITDSSTSEPSLPATTETAITEAVATSTNTEAAPEPPIIPETDKSPLPVANAAPPSMQISADLAWDGVQRTTKVPILMYHYISTPPVDADIYRKDLSVTPELFSAQLDRIQAEGYTTISLYDLLAHLSRGADLPAKPVVITFDDGYRDNYENAFPALKAHGMNATFFVVVEFINKQRPEYMTWDMLREMHGAGMSVEAHGVDHSSLKKQTRDFLLFQALRSYETLQNEIGQRARFVSYPAGQYDQNTIDIFKDAGYWAGITTIQGSTHSTDTLFELRRVRVRGTTQPDELARLLATDW